MAYNPAQQVRTTLNQLIRQPPHDLPLPGPKNDLKPTPGKTPAPTRTVVPKPAPKPGKKVSLTPSQLAQQAVDQSLAPLYAQQRQDANYQNQAITSYTTALMKQLQGVGPQVAQEYANQIGQQTNLSQAAADALRAANPNTQDQAILSAINAPQAQRDAVANGLGQAFNGGAAVGQYVGGVLPIGTLRGEGLQAETLARLQPGFAGLRGAQALAGALYQQRQDRGKLDAQRPDLVRQYTNDYISQQNNVLSQKAKQQQLALERQALGLKTQNQSFNQGATITRLTQSDQRIRNQQDQWLSSQRTRIDEFNARQSTVNAKLGLPNNSLSRSRGYLVDSRGNAIKVNGKRQILPGFKANANGRIVKVATKGGKNGGFTPVQIQKYRGTAAIIANRSKNGYQDVKGAYGPANKTYPPVSPYEAWQHMREAGVPADIAINAINRAYGTNFNPKGNLP